jgi:hypothetical protein
MPPRVEEEEPRARREAGEGAHDLQREELRAPVFAAGKDWREVDRDGVHGGPSMPNIPRGAAMIRASMKARTDTMWVAGLLAGVAALLTYTLGLRSFSFSAPFSYASDSLQYMMVFRTVLEDCWYTHTDMLARAVRRDALRRARARRVLPRHRRGDAALHRQPRRRLQRLPVGGFFATTWASLRSGTNA